MSSFSFIHAADLHLDSPFSALGQENPDLASHLRSSTYEAFEHIISLGIEKQVDFLLVAGDVYDGEERSLRAQVKFRDSLKRLDEAGIRSFIVHGNHDPLDVWSSSLDWPPGVCLFGDSLKTVSVKRDNEILTYIQGISYPKRDEKRNLSRLFRRTGPEFHIGLLHANVGSDTGHEPYAPCSIEDLRRPEMDYWALGHVHTKKIVSPEGPCILYPGNTQGRNIRETGEKGCYLVRIDADRGIETEFHATDVIRWETGEIQINDMESDQDLINALNTFCRDISEKESDRASIVRLSLTGAGSLSKGLGDQKALYDLIEIARDIGMSYSPFVWIDQIKLRIYPEMDFISLMKKQDFMGEILRYSDELLRNTDFGKLIKVELSPLFEDSRARRFLEYPDVEKLKALFKEAEMTCLQALYGEENR